MTSRDLLITGPARSGTTLVGSLIAETIYGRALPPEVTPLSEVLSLVHRLQHGLDADRDATWLAGEEVGRELIQTATRALLDRVTVPGRGAIAKCPRLVQYPRELGMVVDMGVRVLLCVRDPLDVMASAYEVQRRQRYGNSRRYYEESARRAFAGVEAMLPRAEADPEHVAVLRYEDFVGNPRAELRRAAHWLGLEPMRVEGDLGTALVREPANPHHTSLRGAPPTSQRVGSYPTRLTHLQRRRLGGAFADVRARLGYSS